MSNPHTNCSVKKTFLAVLLLSLAFGNSCMAGRDEDYTAKYGTWADEILPDLEFDEATITEEQYRDLENLVSLRPVDSTARGDLMELIEDIIYASMDNYGLYYWEDFKVIDEFDEDPQAPDYDMGQKILALGQAAMTEPTIIPEAPEEITAIFKQSAPDHRIILSYIDGDGNQRYLSADSRGFLKGGSDDPIDAAANFELLLIEDKIGFRSKSRGNMILSVDQVTPDSSWFQSAIDEESQVRFDAKKFSGKDAVGQQLIAEPAPNTTGYYLRGAAFSDPDTENQVGYLVMGQDLFCRAQDPNTDLLTSPTLKGFDQTSASVFTLEVLTKLHRDLAKARQYNNVKSKVDTFQAIINNRGDYIFTFEDLRLLLEEIENMLSEAEDDEKIRSGLEENSDSFYAMIDQADGNFADEIPSAKPFSRFFDGENWVTGTKKKFEEVTGQIPKNFDSMLYPDQVANLTARFARLSSYTIEQFMLDMNSVMSQANVVQAFENTEIPSLKRIITQLPLKNAYIDYDGIEKGNYSAWQTAIDPASDGVLANFDLFMEDNFIDFIKDLEESLKDSDGNLRSQFTKQEQDFFIKKIKRLVDNRELARDSISSDHGNRPYLDVLKEIINQAAINLMTERYEELSKIAATLETDQVQVFDDIKEFSSRLEFLEKRRFSVQGTEEVVAFVENFWNLTSDRYKAKQKEIDRMRNLADALDFTKEFTTDSNKSASVASLGKTVEEVIGDIKNSLKATPTYEDLFPRISSLADELEAGNDLDDSELEYVYSSSFFLSEQTQLDKTQIDNLSNECRIVINNISATQYGKFGKKLQDLIDTLSSMADEMAKAVSDISDFARELNSMEADLKAFTSSTAQTTKVRFLEDLEKLIYNRLNARNADELTQMKSLVEWAYNHPEIKSISGVFITSKVNLKKYSSPKFLDHLVELAESEITFMERVKNLEATIKKVQDGDMQSSVLIEKANKMAEIAQSASSDDLESALELLNKIMFQDFPSLRIQLKTARDTIENRKNQLVDVGEQDFGGRFAELEKLIFAMSESQVAGFVEELWWLVNNRVKGTIDEIERLEAAIEGKMRYDDIFRDRDVPDYPGGDPTRNISSQAFFDALMTELAAPISFADRLKDLQSMEVSATDRSKKRYLQKATAMVDQIEEFEVDPSLGELGQADKDVLNDAIFELNSKKAFKLASVAIKLEPMISAITAKLGGIVEVRDKTYTEEISELEQKLNKITKSNYTGFAEDLSALVGRQVEAVSGDVDKLKGLLETAQYDPLFEGDQTYNQSWFRQKMLALDNGPGLSAIADYVRKTRIDYINAIKSGETISANQKEAISHKIKMVLNMLDTVKVGDIDQLNKLKQDITATKMRIMPERAANLDGAITKIDEKVVDLTKTKEIEPTDFKSDLEELKNALEELFMTSDEDEKAVLAEAFSTELEGMVARISEALKAEREELMTVVQSSERLEAIRNTTLDFTSLVGKLNAGPTGSGMATALEEMTSKTDLTKRERELVVEIATVVDQKKSSIYTDDEGSTTLRKAVDALKTIATFQLKKFKRESGTVESLASKVEGFLASFDQELDLRWAKFSEGLVTIQGLPLSGLDSLNDFVAELSTLVENKAYATQDEINDLIGLLTGPFVTNSPAYFTHGDEVAERIDPIISELQKPLTFKLRAENLLALISNDQQVDYETLVSERLDPLVADRNSAFSEGYKLDRLINAIGFLQSYVEKNPYTTAPGEKRPLDLDQLEKYKEQLNETVLQMGRKQQTSQDRIAAAETILKSSKNKSEVERFFRELESIVESKIEFNSSELKSIERKLIGAAGRRGEWRKAPGMTKDVVRQLERDLEAFKKELAKPVKNKDRLAWLNMKIYGSSDPGSSKSVTDDEMTPDEQEMFLKISKTALSNARQSSELVLQGFVDVLWDSYYYENKIGESSSLEKMAYSFEEAVERKSAGTSYRDQLEILETQVNDLVDSSEADSFLDAVSGLVTNKAEALDDEVERLQSLLQLAKSKRAVQATSGGVKKVTEMLEAMAVPVSPEELFEYICGEVGVDSEDGKPGPTDTPDQSLLDGDPDKISLMVIKIGELVAMKQQISEMNTLQVWKEALSFTMNNELSSKRDEIQTHLEELSAYISGFQSSVFKTVSQRIEDLAKELKTIPEVKYGDAPDKILAFVDGLDDNLVRFRTDADTGSANEQNKMVEFLSKKARLHSLVFTDKKLRKKVDDLAQKAKDPIPFVELADRLEEITFANTSFSEDVKKTFIIVLGKAVDAREGAPQDKVEYLRDEIISFATNRRFNQSTDKSKLDEIADLTDLIASPTIGALLAAESYQEAYDAVEVTSATPSAHSDDEWHEYLTKLASPASVNALVEGKSPEDKKTFLEGFKAMITKIASAMSNAEQKAELEALNVSGASVDDLIALRDYPAALDKLIEDAKIDTASYTKEQWSKHLTKLSGVISRLLAPKAKTSEKVAVLRSFSKLVQDVVKTEFIDKGDENDKAMGNLLIDNIVFRKIDGAMNDL